ncbi:unnamed protein product [Polarella glacialis]|uniref:Prolyl 4-hydroxylase alpha subunit domain-containing protein n=1 Tax=Polarella glacialis TaxID=89957 RepID=A0A813GD02_POLGL|nr:unnamed protein product [Polarella glacialis]
MLVLRRMSWDFLDVAGMRAKARREAPGQGVSDILTSTLEDHVIQLHSYLQDLQGLPPLDLQPLPAAHAPEDVARPLPPPQRLRPSDALELELAGGSNKIFGSGSASGSLRKVSVPAVGLDLTGLAPWRCHQAARWVLDLGIRHLHVGSSARCWRAAQAALGRAAAGSWNRRPGRRYGRLFVSAALKEGAVWLKSEGGSEVDLVLRPPTTASMSPGTAAEPRVATALDSRDFCDWSPYLGGSCVGAGAASDMFGGSSAKFSSAPPPRAAASVVVRLRLQQTSEDFPVLRPLEDPQLRSLSGELLRSPTALLARLHLQAGRGVLIEARTRSRAELWSELRQLRGFSLSREHVQRLGELPGLAWGKIGSQPRQTLLQQAKAQGIAVSERVQTGSEDDAYGLGDWATPNLNLMIEDQLQKSLQAALPAFLSAAPCLRPAACADRDAGGDPAALVSCLLKTFQPSQEPSSSSEATAPPPSAASPTPEWAARLAESMKQKLMPGMQEALSYDSPQTYPPRWLVLDGLLPLSLVAGLQEEIRQRPLCDVLEDCSTGRLSCDLEPGPVDFLRISSPIQTLLASEVNSFMLSSSFLQVLREATNRSLGPVEGFLRGNVLETLPSGYLGLHEDRSERLQRLGAPVPFEDRRLPRLNVILFLHDMDDESTGHLEFWSSDRTLPNALPRRPVARVAVKRNRLVIFDTVDGIHGIPWPLTGNQSRRVLQWYYVQDDAGPSGPSLIEHNMPQSCSWDSCYGNVEIF